MTTKTGFAARHPIQKRLWNWKGSFFAQRKSFSRLAAGAYKAGGRRVYPMTTKGLLPPAPAQNLRSFFA
jgi:hypothetical protein